MTTQSFRSSSLGDALQANRLPIALIGVGVAWLLVKNTSLAERVVRDERIQAARRRISEIRIGNSGHEASAVHEASAGYEASAGRAGQILGPSGKPAIGPGDIGRTDGWVHLAAGAARGAMGSVRDAGNAVLDRAGSISDHAANAADLAQRAGGQLTRQVERDPWLIGVAGLVAGALVAAMLPPTKVEQALIEQARDELHNKASAIGHKAAERVRELAEASSGPSQH